MHITEVKIRNFKGYDTLDLKLNSGMNILVGDNEAKKSTILEAINLALSGIIDGKYLSSENLNDFLFNNKSILEFKEAISKGQRPETPPQIIIELHFSDDTHSDFEGTENILGIKAKGLYYRIGLRQEYEEAYQKLGADCLGSLPLELYTIELKRFSGGEQARALLPIKNSLIDTSSNFQNASDLTISRILKEKLNEEEKIKAGQYYRNFKESYKNHQIHQELGQHVDHPNATVSIDPSSKNSWDSHLSIYIKEIPFSYIGKGLQTILKTKVSLSSKKTTGASVVLIEEPENHLSHATLNELVNLISDQCTGKQIIITSHSSFVANKLDLGNLIFLNDGIPYYFSDLKKETKDFFKKLPGYDTLRLLLCKSGILVEGDADELIAQRAFLDNNGALPINKGIDIISVNNSYRRFLDIAIPLKKKTSVMLDMDNRYVNLSELKKELREYDFLDAFFEENSRYSGSIPDYNKNTLEPLLLAYNSRELLNKIFNKKYATDDELLVYMNVNKTKCALDIFESSTKINYPKYILDAIAFVSPITKTDSNEQ